LVQLRFVSRADFQDAAELTDIRVKDVDLVPDHVVVDVLVEPVGSVDQNPDLTPDITQQLIVGERKRTRNGLGLLAFEEITGYLKFYMSLRNQAVRFLVFRNALKSHQHHTVLFSNRAGIEQVTEFKTLIAIIYNSDPE
jgi:hypothetical protein